MSYFSKHNRSGFKDILYRESEGLELLRNAAENTPLHIPEVISVNEQILSLQQINSRPATDTLMSRLGRGLAQLHTEPHSHFGLAYDNYIGLNPQRNTVTDNWGEFFVDYRLGFQIELIQDPLLQKQFTSQLQNHRDKLTNFLNHHCDYPSLVHGDLWNGNALFDDQHCWLIDPAVYFGDREVDLAMTEMFGGFSTSFYEAYDKVLPRSAAYLQKRTIYNLYHYLNHYNLFGTAYLRSCQHGMEYLQQL